MNPTSPHPTHTDNDGLWRQTNVAFTSWPDAERAAVTHLAPALASAQHRGLLSDWFIVRKRPCWRIRYQAHRDAAHRVHDHLQRLPRASAGDIVRVTPAVYEPERHAFGGTDAMATAHRLFSRDTHHLLAHLTDVHLHHADDRRRELALLLATELLRAAGLDWYEQGDVWARVAEHRPDATPLPPAAARALATGVRRLMTADTTIPRTPPGPLAFAEPWFAAYTAAGNDLDGLHTSGRLGRGLRAVLAHHVIFAFNRFGLPYATQAALATAATTTVFGPAPTTTPPPARTIAAAPAPAQPQGSA